MKKKLVMAATIATLITSGNLSAEEASLKKEALRVTDLNEVDLKIDAVEKEILLNYDKIPEEFKAKVEGLIESIKMYRGEEGTIMDH